MCPVPGSELYRECKQDGLFKNDITDLKSWNSVPPLRYKHIKDEDLLCAGRLFPWFINVYLGLEDYANVIKDYQIGAMPSQEQIIQIDKELDSRHKGRSHYAFLDNEVMNMARCILRD